MNTCKLAINPTPKPRMTQSDRWKKRPAVVRYHRFCDDLRAAWMSESDVQEVPSTIWLTFTIPMPASWSEKKKKEMDGMPHQQRPDIDNFEKAFLDALCEDDSHVYCLLGEKYWGREGAINVSSLQSSYQMALEDS